MVLEDISGGKQVIRAAAICFTDAGERAAGRIPSLTVYRSGKDFIKTKPLVQSLLTGSHRVAALLFFSSAGIAVRMIAPYIADKFTDPAVIVINDTAEYVIPLLSGHMGRANELARYLADILGAEPVITTASDHRNGTEAPDLWAMREGYTILDRAAVKRVTAAVVAGREVEKIRQDGNVVWRITSGTAEDPLPEREAAAFFSPRKYVVGLGCRKGTDAEKLRRFLNRKLEQYGIPEEEIFKICSIDLKKDEEGMLDLTGSLHRPFVVYTADQLNQVEGVFSSSEFVAGITGTDNVCERSALAGCAPWSGQLLMRKVAEDGMTAAIAERQL